MDDDVSRPGAIPGTSPVENSSSRADLRAAAGSETLREDNRRVRLELDDLREENRRLRAATQQMRAEIMLLSRAVEPMHRLNEALETSRAAKDVRADAALQGQIDLLARRLDATYRSTSWRLTRPVRVLSRLVRGQRGADWPEP